MTFNFPEIFDKPPTKEYLLSLGCSKSFIRLGMRIATKSYLKTSLAEAQNWRCCWCHTEMTAKTATIEHVRPRSLNGADHKDNYVAACSSCNSKRGTLPVEVFLLQQQPPVCMELRRTVSKKAKYWNKAAKFKATSWTKKQKLPNGEKVKHNIDPIEWFSSIDTDNAFKKKLVMAFL